MHACECKDLNWIVAYGVEIWIREREDDGQDWRRNVLEDGGPEYGDLPILGAVGDGGVEVTV